MADSRPEAGGPAPARVVVFRLAGQPFAVPLAPVLEVILHRAPTPVPRADPEVLGVLPFRGRMLTLVDTRRCLGLEPRPSDHGARIIVLDGDAEGLIGLVVDEVQGVTPPPGGVRVLDPPSLLRGGTRSGGGA